MYNALKMIVLLGLNLTTTTLVVMLYVLFPFSIVLWEILNIRVVIALFIVSSYLLSRSFTSIISSSKRSSLIVTLVVFSFVVHWRDNMGLIQMAYSI